MSVLWYLKPKYCFNFLCLNEKLNFSLICLFLSNTAALSIPDFMGVYSVTLCGQQKCIRESVFPSNFIKKQAISAREWALCQLTVCF